MTVFRNKVLASFILLLLLIIVKSNGFASEEKIEKNTNSASSPHEHMSMDRHAAHRAMKQSKKINVTLAKYQIPEITLIDSNGNNINLKKILNSERPVAVNFIFTTCTTICPVMTSTFAQVRRKLKDQGVKMSFISITIDPEYDRPHVLNKYAANFNPGSDWVFLTGTSKNISTVIKRFDANDGTKMNHRPLTLFKKTDSEEWVRADGLATSSELVKIITERLMN